MGDTVEVTTEPAMVACDIGTRWEVRCAHGVTPYLEVPGALPQSEERLRQRLVAQHREAYGCNCAQSPAVPHPS